LPTFSIASAINWPTSSSDDEIEATWAIDSLLSIGLEIAFISATAALTAFSIPLRITIGFAPAVTFFNPSRIIAWANTVAVVVPSPATSFVLVATSLTNWAPIFSNGSSSSISFAIVTPSFVINGDPYFFSSTTLRPFGPKVTLTTFANASTPLSILRLASSPKIISLAININSLKRL